MESPVAISPFPGMMVPAESVITLDQRIDVLVLGELAEQDPIFRLVASDMVRAGRAMYDYTELPSIVVESARTAETRLLATFDCRTEARRAIWEDETHKKYFQVQSDLTRRGVQIRRVLILPPRRELRKSIVDQLARVVGDQLSIGVELRAVYSDKLGSWDEDLVIVDQRRIHRYKLRNGSGFGEIVLAIDRSSIASAEQVFDDIWERAETWDGLVDEWSASQRSESILDLIDRYAVDDVAPSMESLREQMARDIARDHGMSSWTTETS